MWNVSVHPSNTRVSRFTVYWHFLMDQHLNKTLSVVFSLIKCILVNKYIFKKLTRIADVCIIIKTKHLNLFQITVSLTSLDYSLPNSQISSTFVIISMCEFLFSLMYCLSHKGAMSYIQLLSSGDDSLFLLLHGLLIVSQQRLKYL